MADPFIEEQFNAAAAARYGATYTEGFAVERVEVAGGREYPRLRHPHPMRTWDFSTIKSHDDLWAGLLSLYWRTYGGFGGFRLKDWDEYSTNGRIGTPTPTDQPMALVSGLIYQLQKQYGSGATLSIGKPVRTLFKPVAGTTRVAIGGVEITNTGATRWTVDTTTGQVTLAADKTRPVTAITQASQAVLDVGSGHGFVVNDVVHVSTVVGMTQINGLRGTVTAVGPTTITVGINSSAFSAYASGGVVHTAPQTSPAVEAVTAGCQFDFPVRFASEIAPSHAYPTHSDVGQVLLREMLAL